MGTYPNELFTIDASSGLHLPGSSEQTRPTVADYMGGVG